MLDNHITELFKDLGLGTPPPFEKDGSKKVQISTITIDMLEKDGAIQLSALIAPPPTKEKEEFLLTLMKANFLGQGTGGGVLGLKEDESFLTLSLSLPYEINYGAFKDAVEEFINYLEYWKTETARYEAGAQTK